MENEELKSSNGIDKTRKIIFCFLVVFLFFILRKRISYDPVFYLRPSSLYMAETSMLFLLIIYLKIKFQFLKLPGASPEVNAIWLPLKLRFRKVLLPKT